MAKRPEVPADLTPQEKRRLMKWIKQNFPQWYKPHKLQWLVGETLDYWGARDNPRSYTDWVRVCQNRVRDIERRGWNPFDHEERGDRERPQERGKRGGDVNLADVIQLAGRR